MTSATYEAALDATKRFHATHKTFSGKFLFHYAEDIRGIIDTLGCRSMLDYGCGKGVQYETPMPSGEMLVDYLGVEITKYDPAWPRFAEEPKGKFDLVICTQALCYVPVPDHPWVVDRLHGYANIAVYVGEKIGPIKKKLHDDFRHLMPHNYTREQWAETLHRDGRDCFLRTFDPINGNILGRI